MIGNSYGQVLHAHLLNPVSEEMTSMLEHEGQNSVAIWFYSVGPGWSYGVWEDHHDLDF